MVLQIIWFVLWAVLWSLYFMTDGFVMGCGILHFSLGKNETSRRMLIKCVGPVWNGNEVWLVTAAGATFAAFPTMYAALFSCLYTAMLVLLFSLILRGISLEFRDKEQPIALKKIWDVGIFLGGIFPSFLFGVAFGNIFCGLPLDASGYHGSFLSLFTPFPLITGALFTSLFSMHGALYAAIKNEGDLGVRAEKTAKILWPFLLGITGLFLIGAVVKTGLFLNYLRIPVLLVVPFVAIMALVLVRYFITKRRLGLSFSASCVLIVAVVVTGMVGIYPNLIVSQLDPVYSLTIFNASSSAYTLMIMTFAALILVPMVIAYKVWVYRIFRGKVTEAEAFEAEDGY